MSDASPVAPTGELEVSAAPVKQTNSTSSFSEGGGFSNGGGSGGGRLRDETTTNTSSNSGNGYNIADDPAYKALLDQNKQLTDAMNELKEQYKRPEKLGAEYWANILGEDYNLENILNRYNQKQMIIMIRLLRIMKILGIDT